MNCHISCITKLCIINCAQKKMYRTQNGVKRVFMKHHQLTLQYLTDEVLKLKYAKQ